MPYAMGFIAYLGLYGFTLSRVRNTLPENYSAWNLSLIIENGTWIPTTFKREGLTCYQAKLLISQQKC